MSENIRFIFSETIVRPYILRLRLCQAFSDASFTQNNFLFEPNFPKSALHFSFTRNFHSCNFVPFCYYLKLIFWMWFTMVQTVCRYAFSSARDLVANIGVFLKSGSLLGSESANMLIRGVVVAVRVVKNYSTITLFCLPFVFITICFHSTFTFTHL